MSFSDIKQPMCQSRMIDGTPCEKTATHGTSTESVQTHCKIHYNHGVWYHIVCEYCNSPHMSRHKDGYMLWEADLMNYKKLQMDGQTCPQYLACIPHIYRSHKSELIKTTLFHKDSTIHKVLNNLRYNMTKSQIKNVHDTFGLNKDKSPKSLQKQISKSKMLKDIFYFIEEHYMYE